MYTQISIVLAASIFAVSAQAAECIETSKAAPLLEQHYNETLHSVGVLSNNNVIELYHNENTQNWTVMVSVPDKGVSCMVASGTGRYQETLAMLKR